MKKRVAVIYGGRSGEHEVSLRSAKSIIEALDPEKYKVLHYLISKEGKWSPRPIVPEPHGNPEIDVVFPALHGTFGEDGTLQGLLELAGLPYVGAGVLASSVSMDKEVMKRLAKESGLPVVDYLVFSSSELQDPDGICSKFEFPVFVKPANLGSSVGISKAHNCAELKAALELAASFDRKVIVERGIQGREFECAVLGNAHPIASVPCEILPSKEFYDYDDKYLLEKAGTVIPADLSREQTAELQRLAVQCYRAVECEGLARVDFLLETATNRLYINEINTLPGFTSISMYPKMWEYSGLPMPQLVDRLIDLALERHAAKQRLRYTK
jgi:D-alanine-D-alanine ligase